MVFTIVILDVKFIIEGTVVEIDLVFSLYGIIVVDIIFIELVVILKVESSLQILSVLSMLFIYNMKPDFLKHDLYFL